MLKRYFKNIPWFLVTFVVLLYRVYNYVPLEAYTQLMTLSSLIIYIYMIYKTGNSFCSSDFKIERMIIVSLLATLIISVFYWNLNLINVLARYFPAVSILIVFYLKSQRIECSKIEKAIVILTWLYLFCWLIQVFMLPQIIFGGRDETDNLSRGFIRFYIPTKENLAFLLFYYLSLYVNYKKKIYLCLSFLVYIVIVLHVSRQMIVWSGLFGILFLTKQYLYNIKSLITVTLVLFMFGFYFINTSNVVTSLIEMTEESQGGINSLGTDNIRIEAMQYFIKNYSDNIFTIIFGNGYSSSFDALARHEQVFKNLGYYRADVGFVGMYCDTGVISVILYITLFIKVLLFTKVEKKYEYLKYYILYIIFSYLGSHSLTSNLVFVIMSIYILKCSNYRVLKKKL